MTGSKSVVPTTTVTPARVRVYQPTQRPVRINVRFETSWGWCRVSGRLGQRHADLMESILHAAEGSRKTADGAIELLVDPARIRKKLSDAQYSLQQIGILIDDLRGAVVEIRTARVHVLGGLLDHIVPTEMTRPSPLGGAPRHLWTVRLGLPMVKLLDVDLALFYDPSPLCRLRHGISQAVARHVLTHGSNQPNGGWFLDSLIRTVAGDLAGSALRKARARLRDDSAGLLSAGIQVAGDRVFRLPHPPDSVPHPPGKMPKRAAPARVLQDPSGILRRGLTPPPEGGGVPAQVKTNHTPQVRRRRTPKAKPAALQLGGGEVRHEFLSVRD